MMFVLAADFDFKSGQRTLYVFVNATMGTRACLRRGTGLGLVVYGTKIYIYICWFLLQACFEGHSRASMHYNMTNTLSSYVRTVSSLVDTGNYCLFSRSRRYLESKASREAMPSIGYYNVQVHTKRLHIFLLPHLSLVTMIRFPYTESM